MIQASVQFNMELFNLCLGPSFVFLFLYLFVSRLLDRPVDFPESIPVVGLRRQLFKKTRASFRRLTDGIKTLSDGYRQVPSTQPCIKKPKLTNVVASIPDMADRFSSTNPAIKRN